MASFIWGKFHENFLYHLRVLLRGVSCNGWPTSKLVVMKLAQIYGQKKTLLMPFASRESRRLQFPNTVDRRNPKANHLGWCYNPVKNGINYQPQLVSRIPEPSIVWFFVWTASSLLSLTDFCKKMSVAIPITHPWDWMGLVYLPTFGWFFMVKCREIYQSHGLFGIFFWFRFANHNPHTRPNVSMSCNYHERMSNGSSTWHRFSNPPVY